MFKFVGRSKNLWESPIGCLLFSFTIQMVDGKIVPLLQYVISLAITEAIKEICDKNVSTERSSSLFLSVYFTIWE